MKSKFLRMLFLPTWILFLCGVGCLYGAFKFHNQAVVAEAKYSSLVSSIQLVNCQTIDKNVVLSIAQNSFEQVQSTATLFGEIGLLILAIGIINFLVVWGHLKTPQSR